MQLTLITSVLNHLAYNADATAPHAALSTARVVWQGWRKTHNSTLTVDTATLAWLEEELRYLAWRMSVGNLPVTDAGFAPMQVQFCLATVQQARAVALAA